MKTTFATMSIALLLVAGCASIGPSSLENDRYEYSNAMAESWKKMMLLNIVKLRYGDTPIFLEIGSIVSQYTLERELEAAATLQSGDLIGEGLGLTGTGTFSDRPTITYNPLIGEKFTKSLLTPIPPHALLTLIQSGWDAELLLQVCLSAVNDLHNSSGRRRAGRLADERFLQLIDVIAAIQDADGFRARVIERDTRRSIVFFKRDLDDATERNVQTLFDLLRLNPEKREFSIVYGQTAANDTQIAMLTRSMLDIIAELSEYIDIPAIHIEENRASPGFREEPPAARRNGLSLFVRSSEQRPDDAFLAVRYHDYWFYIEDTDFRSKRIFSFLIFLLSLAEVGQKGLAPVLTLPTG